MEGEPRPLFRICEGQVAVFLHDRDEQLGFTQWTLPILDLPPDVVRELPTVHIRVVFNPPQVHISPLFKRQAENLGKAIKPAEKAGFDTLRRILERRIESESAWMIRFVPAYRQLPRLPATSASSVRADALRALGLNALADYARFLTHFPPMRVWEIADRLRRATPRFIEPNLVDSRSGWDRRIPPRGQLRRSLNELREGGSSEISLLEILKMDSRSLADVMEQWPERYGPRRRLLVWNALTLPESTWDELLGSRVNASLEPETSDTADRLVLHLRPEVQNNTLAVAYVLALMGFTYLQRSNGLTSILNPQLENTAIPADASDDEVEEAYDIAAKWIEKHSVDD